tara:strand:- start:250 stop:519 length:270 start_codon:yes stop_codon:yes gene_type:complete
MTKQFFFAIAAVALVGCSSQPKQLTAVEQRAVDAYVDLLCAPAIDDEFSAGLRDFSVQMTDLSAHHDPNGGDPVQQKAVRIARERGCVS